MVAAAFLARSLISGFALPNFAANQPRPVIKISIKTNPEHDCE